MIGWGWGLTVAFGVYVAGGVLGAHLNQAVTVAFAARRGFPWKKVIPYCIAQVLGAFVGAALVFANDHDAIKAYEKAANIVRGDPSGNTTFSIFATFPAPYFNGGWFRPLLDQICGIAFLVLWILAAVEQGADVVTVLEQATAAARTGMEAMTPMRSTKGRASYLGERSIGHQDPGRRGRRARWFGEYVERWIDLASHSD